MSLCGDSYYGFPVHWPFLPFLIIASWSSLRKNTVPILSLYFRVKLTLLGAQNVSIWLRFGQSEPMFLDSLNILEIWETKMFLLDLTIMRIWTGAWAWEKESLVSTPYEVITSEDKQRLSLAPGSSQSALRFSRFGNQRIFFYP